MKVGYCMALGMAAVAVPGAVALYHDLQDGEYGDRAVYMAVAGGVLAAVFALVPGAPVVFWRYAPPGAVAQRLSDTPVGTRWMWAGGFVLGLGLANGANNYLQSQLFLGLSDLFAVRLVGLLAAFFARQYLRP